MTDEDLAKALGIAVLEVEAMTPGMRAVAEREVMQRGEPSLRKAALLGDDE